ncbi:hypothetical protein QW060_08695 [Myroides ceti]|uniref:Cytochrome c domain-containing protein n=1 Tax=Paenimyroides ceti TaxID=395087 RepID=A0ABT8CTX2_9FLAO|nr:hypothetical protein [Paenimyroides ceti]MDN3707211.1 hypothetical protein [Paenimyroides ceti]
MKQKLRIFKFLIPLLIISCNNADNLYEDIPEKATKATKNYVPERLDMVVLKKYIEGNYAALKGKDLLWDYSYTYEHTSKISAYIIPIKLKQDNSYEFIAIADSEGRADMALIKFESEKVKFDENVYSVRPYEIAKEYNFKGNVRYTQFKDDVFKVSNSFNSPTCNKCHKDGSGPEMPGFPDETLPEMVIVISDPLEDAWDIKNPISIGGGVVLHPPEPPADPCKNFNKNIKNNLHNTNQILEVLSQMVNSLPLSEKGFMIDADGNVTGFEENDDSATLEMPMLPYGKKINTLIHSHYDGLLIGPSPADLIELHRLYMFGNINNYQSFEFGIVSSEGYMSVTIDSPLYFSFNMIPLLNETLLSSIFNTLNLTPENRDMDNYANNLAQLFKLFNVSLSITYKKNDPKDNDWNYYDKKENKFKKC